MINIPNKFNVIIDQECIDNGVCSSAQNCAVSLAVNKRFGQDFTETRPDDYDNDWLVSVFHIDDDGIEHCYRFSTDNDMSIWATAFDEGLGVTPVELIFSHTLDYDATEDGDKYINYIGDVRFAGDYNLDQLARQIND